MFTSWLANFLGIDQYPGLGPFFGAIIASLFAATAAWRIAARYTKSIKTTEATFEFSKRFQELLQKQLELNKEYKAVFKDCTPPIEEDDSDAIVWWWRFFDLMLYEFQFFRDGLVVEDRFIEWMKWRRYDFNSKESELWSTCGLNYPAAWHKWKTRLPMQGNPFINFLDMIHDPKKGEVGEIVRTVAPRRWRRK